jgi:hypothetical protein
MIIYGNDRSKRRKPGVKQTRANAAHAEWLKSIGYYGKRKDVDRSYNLECSFLTIASNRVPSPVSNTIGNGFKGKSVDDYKWRKDLSESRETIAEIERKKSRIAPAYSKGANQYITDGADPQHIGKKV